MFPELLVTEENGGCRELTSECPAELFQVYSTSCPIKSRQQVFLSFGKELEVSSHHGYCRTTSSHESRVAKQGLLCFCFLAFSSAHVSSCAVATRRTKSNRGWGLARSSSHLPVTRSLKAILCENLLDMLSFKLRNFLHDPICQGKDLNNCVEE